MKRSPTLEQALKRDFRFIVEPDPEEGIFIHYPDLPGCMTQVDTYEEVIPAAEEIKRLWIQAAWNSGWPIPEPAEVTDFSGKFNVRIPRSLHRRLAEQAEVECVSLNQLVVSYLSAGAAGKNFTQPNHPIAVVVTSKEQSGTFWHRYQGLSPFDVHRAPERSAFAIVGAAGEIQSATQRANTWARHPVGSTVTAAAKLVEDDEEWSLDVAV